MNVILSVKIDGKPFTGIDIHDFKLVYDIETHLPTGEITIKDPTGILFAKMEMMIGSEVEMALTGDKVFKLPTMRLARLYHDDTLDPSRLGGYFVLVLGHDWEFFKDFTPHAYPPMKNSELITKILADSTRGLSYDRDDNIIMETDDKGAFPRYKTEQSDFEFITETLLPLSTIGYQPAYFYFDTNGNYNLVSFKEQYSKQPYAVVSSPHLSSNGDDSMQTKVDSTQSKKLVAGKDFLFLIGGTTDVTLLDKLRPKVYLDNLDTHTVLSGPTTPTNKLTGESGNTSGNKIPVSVMVMYDNTPSGEIIPINRMWDDQMSIIINNNRDLDNMFRLEVNLLEPPTTAFTVGQPVNIVLNAIESGTSSDSVQAKVHWLSGKWLVKSITYGIVGEGSMEVTSHVTLAKPTFTINKTTTTLTVPDLFYSV